jgi:putative redox protein
MAKENDARAVFVGPMRFDVTSGSGHTIALDVVTADGGADSGASPMELLLMALAGCTGMDVIGILKKMRQDVRGYEIRVHGVRAAEHPKVYVQVSIDHVVTGHNVDPAAVARAIELSDTKYCGVENTLNKTAQVTSTFRIVESGE